MQASKISPSDQPKHNLIVRFIRAFWLSAKQEWSFLIEHRWDFAMMFWLPLMFTFLIWWIFSRGAVVDIPIAVIDHSHSPQSATLIRYIDATPEVNVVTALNDQSEAEQAIQATQIYGVVEIPTDFSRNLLSAVPTRVLLNVNAQFGTHSGLVQKGVQTAVKTFSAGAEMQRRVAKGEDFSLVTTSYAPIQTQAIGLFNTANNYQQFLAVAVIPAILHILSMVIGSSTVGRELRDKTIGQWYASIDYGNIKPSFWVLVAGLNGKLIWAMLAYTLWGAVALTLVTRILPVPMASLTVTYAIFLMLMMVSFWMGVIVTVGTFSYRQGLSFTGFISAPSFAFSGLTFPFLAMSPAAQHWANGLPLTHYLRLQTAQLQMGAPASFAMPTFYGFMAAVAVTLVISALLTKKALGRPEKWGQR